MAGRGAQHANVQNEQAQATCGKSSRIPPSPPPRPRCCDGTTTTCVLCFNTHIQTHQPTCACGASECALSDAVKRVFVVPL